jgi:O-antigen/teichoic acid export membrane protein
MSIARSALFNLFGHVAPLAAAIFALPLLVSRLDPARFGFLSLAWVVVGYFSLADLGLGRALTRLIAARLDSRDDAELSGLTRTALLALCGLGAAAGSVLFVLAPWLCGTVLKLPEGLQSEATTASKLLFACLPFVTLTAALRGVLEARQRFGWVNSLRIPLGVLTFLVPVAATAYTADLITLCAALAVLRVIACGAHWAVCARLYPELILLGTPSRRGLTELFGYGLWLTVSNVVGPLMVYLDRFVIGALASVTAVAYYTAPYEVVTRLWLVPAALTGVLFPVFASSHATDPARAQRIYRKGLIMLIATMAPLSIVTALSAPYWLEAWLGTDYAREGLRVAQILAVGVLFNSLAHLPFSLLQAAGRADLTAKTHLAELPLYVAALAWLVPTQGIAGAAIVWTGRCLLDAVVMFMLAQRQMRSPIATAIAN